MPGIENIDYDDMKVVVELDESTGKISSTTMDCHAEFQYQDCEAEGDYHIDYRFTGDGNSASAGAKAETEEKSRGRKLVCRTKSSTRVASSCIPTMRI